MESKDAKQKNRAEIFAVALYETYIGDIENLTDEALNHLLDSLREFTLAATTESVRRNGITTSCGCTDTHHKPLTINMPGVGNVSYSGD